MGIDVDLDPEIFNRLEEESRRSGETIDATANRLLRQYFGLTNSETKAPVVESFALETPEKWKGLTPSQILHEMDIEEYEEKRDRARHESAAVRV
jgi:hypothetical protein